MIFLKFRIKGLCFTKVDFLCHLKYVKKHLQHPQKAKTLIDQVKSNGGQIPAGVTKDQVWDAKYIYDSAYHPTTGELVFMPGRMSFQGE